MTSTACRDGSGTWRLLLFFLVAAAVASPGLAQTGTAQKKGTVQQVKVPGASLQGNLEGDAPDRDVFIYLPPSYATSPTQRYPVVYLLHGYGLTAERWMPFTRLADTADRLIAAGTIKEMIFVNPDAYTVHGGSMYSASPTTGDWETYIAEDLVGYVDRTYRTLANRDSRGLGGHSMGGYGTLRIGMKRPDVFSSMYPMSACCLIDATVAGGGRGGGGRGAAGRGAGDGAPAGQAGAAPQAAAAPVAPAAPAAPVAPAAAAANAAPAAAPQATGARGDGRGAGPAGAGRGGRGGGFGNVQFALAAAWAPNPKNPPNFFDQPTVDGVPQPLVVAKFAANSPFVMIPQYVTNLKKYKAIKLDVGDKDGLAGQNRQVEESLTAFGVTHTFETYEGGHSDKVPERFEQSVLPFFSTNLSFTAPKK